MRAQAILPAVAGVWTVKSGLGYAVRGRRGKALAARGPTPSRHTACDQRSASGQDGDPGKEALSSWNGAWPVADLSVSW